MDGFSQVFDVTLLATIGLVVAVSLVIAYIGSRRRDVCLKCFDHFQVTLLPDNGRRVQLMLLELKRRTAESPENRSRLLAASQPAGPVTGPIAAQVDTLINGADASRQEKLGAPEVGGG